MTGQDTGQGSEGRLHTSVLVRPEGELRTHRRAREHAAARLRAEARDAERALARARYEADRDQRRSTVYLPQAGEPGPAMLRTPGRFRTPRHQDTSATLAGHYPFLAEGGLGSAGTFIGQDLYSGGSFVYDPWELYRQGLITAPNLILAGIVGAGKSSLAKSLYTRGIPFGRRVYVPGDPKGEHTAVAHAVGGHAIVLGPSLPTRLNPLDEGYRATGIPNEEWAAQVAARRRDLIGALAETVLDRRLSPVEHTAIDIALSDTVRSADVPILPMVVERILTPAAADDPDGRLAEDGRLVGHALRRLVSGDLSGLFDGPSTETFDPTLPMLSLDLSRVAENSALLAVLMTCSSAWMEAALQDPRGGHRMVVYDEAWRLMSYPALLARMDAQWRLARHLGIANLLIFHKLTDLDNVGDQGSRMRALASSRTRKPGSSTGRNPTSSASPPRPSDSPAPSNLSSRASASGKGFGRSRTAPSSCNTNSTPPNWNSSTPDRGCSDAQVAANQRHVFGRGWLPGLGPRRLPACQDGRGGRGGDQRRGIGADGARRGVRTRRSNHR